MLRQQSFVTITVSVPTRQPRGYAQGTVHIGHFYACYARIHSGRSAQQPALTIRLKQP